MTPLKFLTGMLSLALGTYSLDLMAQTQAPESQQRLSPGQAARSAWLRKERGMNASRAWCKLSSVLLLLILGVSMSACSKTTSWKEEVLLQDGTTMIVRRSLTRSGASEIGQGPPITEQSIAFTPAGSKEPITWKAESTIQEGHMDLDLLALDIVQGTPYIATLPRGCYVYGKLGRPNPPNIFFKYIGQQWQQIPLQEFPVEIKQPNVVINLYQTKDIEHAEKKTGFVSTTSIKDINSSLREDEFKTILRRVSRILCKRRLS